MLNYLFPHIVEFKDGTYGVRKFTISGWKFKSNTGYVSSFTHKIAWWCIEYSQHYACANYTQAYNALQRKTPVKQKKDYGRLVK